MTEFSVTNQIHHNVLMELLSVLSSNLEDLSYIFHTISINVEDGCINTLGYISAVQATS
jgi:hypothetical protein